MYAEGTRSGKQRGSSLPIITFISAFMEIKLYNADSIKNKNSSNSFYFFAKDKNILYTICVVAR
jgi:hypothetical protein